MTTSNIGRVTLFQLPSQFYAYTFFQLTLVYVCHGNKIFSLLLIFNKAGSVCIKVILRLVRVTAVAVKKKKAVSMTHSECVFADLIIQHAMRMRHIILPYAACLAQPYFST
jgi:hypothetical protein